MEVVEQGRRRRTSHGRHSHQQACVKGGNSQSDLSKAQKIGKDNVGRVGFCGKQRPVLEQFRRSTPRSHPQTGKVAAQARPLEQEAQKYNKLRQRAGAGCAGNEKAWQITKHEITSHPALQYLSGNARLDPKKPKGQASVKYFGLPAKQRNEGSNCCMEADAWATQKRQSRQGGATSALLIRK